MENNTTLLIWLLGIVLVLSLISTAVVFNLGGKLQAGVSEDELKAAIEGIEFDEIEFPEYKVDLSGIEGRLDSLELEVAEFGDEDLSEEAEAERLVLLEIDSRDFKKDVLTALNDWYDDNGYACVEDNCAVEKYRHITEIVVKDLDVVYAGETANVTVDLKIYYYIDGDEDETERARLVEFDFEVDGLDEDEGFEDAEVSNWDNLVVAKVY